MTKQMRFPSILLLGINSIVGSGIFLLPQTLFREAGSLSVLAILVAGAATTLIAFNYADLAAGVKVDGGAFGYAQDAFGDFVGFTTGWYAWFLGIITIAAETAAFLTTLQGVWSGAKTYYIPLAVAIVTLLGLMNWFGPGLAEKADNIASGFKLAVIAVFLVLGGWFAWTHHASMPHVETNGHFFTAAVAAFYMFTGFSFLPTAAQDMKNPAKALPKALVVIMVGVSAVYALIQAVTLLLLGSALASTSLPVATAFARVLGEFGRVVIIVGMLVSIFGVALSVSFATPIGAQALANDHHLLPRVFGRKNRFQAPGLAILVTTITAGLLVVSGGYLFLVKLIVLVSFIQYVTMALAALKLAPKTRLWWKKWPVPLLTIVIVGSLANQFALSSYLIALGVIAGGWLVYMFDKHLQKPAG